LNAIEQIVTDDGAQAAAQIEGSGSPQADPISRPDTLKANP
jgi:hypothetical protein